MLFQTYVHLFIFYKTTTNLKIMHDVENFPLANIYSRLNNANFKDFIILIFKNKLQVTIIITIYMK